MTALFGSPPRLPTIDGNPSSPVRGELRMTTAGGLLFYDGSAWRTASHTGHVHDDRYLTEAEVTAALAGKADAHSHPYAPTAHNHEAGDVNSGTFPVARGGTGRASLTSGSYLRGAGTGAVGLVAPADVRTDIGAEAAGTAASAVSAHESAGNPHPGYATAGHNHDGAYDPAGSAAAAQAAAVQRANHTGTQAISTVSGLQAALDAKADNHGHPYADAVHGHNAISDVTINTANRYVRSTTGGVLVERTFAQVRSDIGAEAAGAGAAAVAAHEAAADPHPRYRAYASALMLAGL